MGPSHLACWQVSYGYRWVYIVKIGPDGRVYRLKARLVAKGYIRIYGFDYYDNFSPVAKMASVRLLLSIAAMRSWPQNQLDIKNAFLNGNLAEEVYMEQPPKFVTQGESSLVCYEILAPESVGHQECISQWQPRRGGIYGATT